MTLHIYIPHLDYIVPDPLGSHYLLPTVLPTTLPLLPPPHIYFHYSIYLHITHYPTVPHYSGPRTPLYIVITFTGGY